MEALDASASILGDVTIAEDVFVGPHCVLDGTMGPIRIASGCRLRGHVYIVGPADIGERNVIYPFSSIGFAPQSLGFDHDAAGAGVRIGAGNTFREGSTVHRATSDETPTTVGDRNYLMVNSHVGHDNVVGSENVLGHGALLGGHGRVDDRVFFGGLGAIHQFVRVGRGAMVSGGVVTTMDLPPFFTLTSKSVAGSLNVVGMRRQELPADVIADIRWVYKTLYRRRLPVSAALDEMRTRADRPIIAEYIEFIETSQRGICRGGREPR